MSLFAQQFNAALQKAMSRSEAASKAGKASAAARKARAGSGQTTDADAARKKADALLAANPGKYGPKVKGGKGKGKGAKPKAAKPKAAAKPKGTPQERANQNRAAVADATGVGADLDGAMSRLNAGMGGASDGDKAQALADKGLAVKDPDTGRYSLSPEGKQYYAAAKKGDVEGAKAAIGNAQGHAEKTKVKAQTTQAKTDAAAKTKADRAAAQATKAQAREKQQAQKQKAAKQKQKAKSKAVKPSAAPKLVAPPAAAEAAARLSSGGPIAANELQNLITNGLARPSKDGTPVLTPLGLKAAQQQTQKLAKAFTPVGTWHGWASITKVDEEQRLVFGLASSESPDAQPGIWKGEAYRGDIIASEAMREAAPDYLQWGNIREMHGASAAGVAVHFQVVGPDTEIGAHIVDDQAWKKVITGTYKGFSIGGKAIDAEIVKIDGLPYRKITKLSLTEISLVDRPANPQARITLYKGDAMADQETEIEDTTLIAKAADPAKVIAMLQELRNAAETSGDLDAADTYTQTIRSVAQASGIAPADGDAMDDVDATDDMPADDIAMDDTGDTDDVMMAIKAGDLRKAFPNHSDDDLIELLLKRGAAISSSTMGHLKGAHDSLNKATGGAVCAQPNQPTAIAQGAAMLAPDDLAKAVAPAFEGIAKLLEQNGLEVKGLAKRMETLERQPAPGAPAARAVEKVLTGDVPPAADPAAMELDVLKKQRETATEPAILKWLGEQIAQREISAMYKVTR